MKTTALAMALLVLTAAAPSGFSQEVVTNEILVKYLGNRVQFNSTHAVMAENKKRLEDLLDFFLAGDVESIRRLSAELTQSMAVVKNLIPQDPEQGIPAYLAIAEIANQSNKMKFEIENNNPFKAYEHYSRVVSSCIQCHQVVRGWGKFPVPAPDEKKPAA